MINKKRLYNLLREIPKGKVSTYRELGRKLNTKSYQAVGQILKRNEDPVTFPCYKIVNSNGNIGGYSGSNPKNILKKIKLLARDGIKIKNKKIDLKKHLYKF